MHQLCHFFLQLAQVHRLRQSIHPHLKRTNLETSETSFLTPPYLSRMDTEILATKKNVRLTTDHVAGKLKNRDEFLGQKK